MIGMRVFGMAKAEAVAAIAAAAVSDPPISKSISKSSAGLSASVTCMFGLAGEREK